MLNFIKYIENEAGYIVSSSRKHWLVTDFSLAFVGFAYFWLSTKIELYVWHSAPVLFAVVTLIVADFITGVWIALRNNKFETNKAMRGVVKLAVYPFLLSIAFNLGKEEPVLAWLPNVVIFPMCLILILSVIKNMSILGFIDNRLAGILYNNIDKYKNENTEIHTDNNSTPPPTV